MYPDAKPPKYVHLAVSRASGFNWMSACRRRVGITASTGTAEKVTCPKCLVAMVIAASAVEA